MLCSRDIFSTLWFSPMQGEGLWGSPVGEERTDFSTVWIAKSLFLEMWRLRETVGGKESPTPDNRDFGPPAREAGIKTGK